MERRRRQKDASIDRHHLDLELERHPQWLLEKAEAYYQAMTEKEEVSYAVDQLKAKVSCEVRKDWDRVAPKLIGEGSRPTEEKVKHAVTLHPTIIKAEEKLIRIKERLNTARAAYDAARARGECLHNLVLLHGQQYFAIAPTRGRKP